MFKKTKKVVIGGGGSNTFAIIQADAGTSPTADSANDTLTLTSSDSSLTITGNATTDTVDFTLASPAWGLTGNAGTIEGTNYVGTSDSKYLSLGTNGSEWLRLGVQGDFFSNGTPGAYTGTYNIFSVNKIMGTISSNFNGFYLGNTFNASITGGYIGYGVSDTWATGSDNSSITGFEFSPTIQSGSTMGLLKGYNFSGSYAVGTLDSTNIDAISITPIIPSDVNNYNGINHSPTLSGVNNGGYSGIIEAPQLNSGFDVTLYKGLNLSPGVGTGASISNFSGFFSGGTVSSGATVTTLIDNQTSTTISAGATVSSYTGLLSSATINADIANVNGITASPTGSGAITGFVGCNVSPTFTGTVTNLTGINISPSSSITTNAIGLNINMGSVSATNRPSALSSNNGLINISTGDITTTNSFPSLVDIANNYGASFKTVSGSPITGTDHVSNFIGGNSVFEDNMGSSAFGLGYVSVGTLGQVAVLSGATVDKYTAYLAAASFPASSTGGTITDAIMTRAAGIINSGGSLTITNMYGFYIDNAVGGFSSATNSWGFYEDTSVENHVSKLAIGTSSKKVANSSVSLDLGASDRAMLVNRMDSTAESSLTAINGMIIYNTTTNKFRGYASGAWVDLH